MWLLLKPLLGVAKRCDPALRRVAIRCVVHNCVVVVAVRCRVLTYSRVINAVCYCLCFCSLYGDVLTGPDLDLPRQVLESFQIMDYSLLVGVHNLDLAAKERTVRSEPLAGQGAPVSIHILPVNKI